MLSRIPLRSGLGLVTVATSVCNVGIVAKLQVAPASQRRALSQVVLHSGVSCRSNKAPQVVGETIKCDCGHDAFFVTETETHHAFGVADGVGGWVETGVNPALFSWTLMENCATVAHGTEEHPRTRDPVPLLTEAYHRLLKGGKVAAGSSTAVVTTIEKKTGRLRVANLGDSLLAVVRDGKVVLRSNPKAQQHQFNAPYQLAVVPSGDESALSDHPAMAEKLSVHLQSNDLVIMASDGFSDNIFDRSLVEIVNRVLGSNPTVEGPSAAQAMLLAETLVQSAFERSVSRTALTPFQENATDNLIPWTGGKMDDITVLVTQIESVPSESEQWDGRIPLL